MFLEEMVNGGWLFEFVVAALQFWQNLDIELEVLLKGDI